MPMLAASSYWVTWFPGVMLAAAGFLAILWKALVWLVNSTRTMKEVSVALPIIQAEFSPNHGTTMKDRVEALHVTVDTLSTSTIKWQKQHARDDDRRFAKVEGSLERIEDHLTKG